MSTEPTENFETPMSSKRARLNTNRESCPANLESEATRSSLGTPLISKFASSGRPYRLNKVQRAQLRQRRLEFQTSGTEKSAGDIKRRDQASYSKEELIELIKKAENELQARAKHEQKVKELKESIEIWKQGFNRVLEDLQEKLQPRENKYLSKQLILQQLHVPLDVLKFLENPED